MRERIRRIVGIILVVTLMVGTSGVTAGAASTSNKVLIYLKPNFTVKMDKTVYILKDAKGQRLYPIVYNGNTYLPIRAVSALMSEEIQWDNYGRTVYIGKTLTNPNKSKIKKDKIAKDAVQPLEGSENQVSNNNTPSVVADLKPDLTLMFDFKIQEFLSDKGVRLYPISYNDSIYIPTQAVSLLMKQTVEWDNNTKTIIIGEQTNTEKKEDTSKAVLQLNQEFEAAIEIYDQATAKIINIKKTKEKEALNILTNSINEDVLLSANQLQKIKAMDTKGFTKEELEAYHALCDFVEISQYYLLVLENIAYMAASGTDYSMLAESFLNFALDSQSKMDYTRDLIEAL